MNIRAGDIEQILINGRQFDPAPESSTTVTLSGFQNESRPTGNGDVHTTRRRKLGGFSELSISVDHTRQDLEFLQNIADQGTPVPVTVTMASGIAYSGSCVLEGELGKDEGEGTASTNWLGKKVEQI